MILSAQDDARRVTALHALNVLDTPAEARFDRFTRLASRILGTPIALISLVDEHRQWFKSRVGIDAAETSRSIAFCSHAVASGQMLVVEDTLADSRFTDNPLVTGNPNIRFYAGQPLFSDGEAVGTLCVIDRAPRVLDDEERRCLRDLADLVEIELNHDRHLAARLAAERALRALNTELELRVETRTAQLEGKVAELEEEIGRRLSAEAELSEALSWNRTLVDSSFSAFIGTDAAGRITEWNAAAARTFGWSRDEVAGRSLTELIVPAALRAEHYAMLRQLADGAGIPTVGRRLEMPALTASGRQLTVEMTISAHEWKGQRYCGAFLSDISERVRARQQLEEKQELLNAVLDSIDIAVVACDALGNLTLFNQAAKVMHGLDAQQIAPSEWPKHYSLFHADGRTPMCMDEVPLVDALKGSVIKDRAMAIAPGGRPMHMLLASGRPLRTAAGRSLGAVVAMKDITELSASREQVVANERRLHAITENLPALIAKVDAAGHFAYVNGLAQRFLGQSAESLVGSSMASVFSIDDFARIEQYVTRVQSGERVSFEDAITTGNQALHYQCVLVPQISSNGKPDGFFAMAFDISARKLDELRQAESEERLRTITDNVPVLIACLDAAGRYQFANNVHHAWLGVDPDRIQGRTIGDMFGHSHRDVLAAAWSKVSEGKIATCQHEIPHDGNVRFVHSTLIPQWRNGTVQGAYLLSTDVTASRQQERDLQLLANTDVLTQLPNRRRFEQVMDGIGKGARQSDGGCALLYLDIDFFKQINDTHGHGVGDEVLVEFSARLRAAVRSADLVARLGGDEFTVLLGDVRNTSDVSRVAGKILDAIRKPFTLEAVTLEVTTTIGASVCDGSGAGPRALMEAADRALYAAKEAGRNTFAIFSPGTDRLAFAIR